MAYLEENSEFIESVLRLDVDTPIRGYDGDEIGPSNEQAQVLASRTKWLKEVLDAVKTKQDSTRDPEVVMKEHLDDPDPHPQYVTEKEGDIRYLNVDEGNKPNGYLKLDQNGYFPAELATLYEARYLIVDDEAERLTVEKNKNITICFQRDENSIYYLNANDDPSVADNWRKGRQAELAPVASVFGRMDEVIAQDGDYNTDQITETANRIFISPDDKKKWNSKQEELASGENIKTVFGQTLLGTGDIGLTDIPNLAKAIGDNLVGSGSVNVAYDESTQKVLIKGKSLSENGALTELIIKEETVTMGDKEYRYDTDDGLSFDYFSSASKRIIVHPKKEVLIDYSTGDLPVTTSPIPETDNTGYYKNGEEFELAITNQASEEAVENYISDPINLDDIPQGTTGINFTVPTELNMVMPIFTSIESVDGYMLNSSDIYGSFYPWKAFQKPLTDEEREEVPNTEYWSDSTIFRNSKPGREIYLGITHPKPIYITSYGFQKFKSYYWTSTSTPPTDWIFQGRNGDDEDWVNLDEQHGQDIMGDADDWTIYSLSNFVGYTQYRLLILNVKNTSARASIPRFQLFNEMGVLIKDVNGNYYAPDKQNIVQLEIGDKSDFAKNQSETTKEPITISQISDTNYPIYFCSLKSGQITVTPCQHPVIITKHDPISVQKTWDGLYHLSLSSFFNPADIDKLVFGLTPDGVRYYKWNDGDWYGIGEYMADESSAKKLLATGMSVKTLNSVTKEGWKYFTSLVKHPQIGIVVALKSVNNKDGLTPKQIALSFEDVYGWQKMSLDKVKVILTDKYISFTPSSEGLYKFCYRFN